MKVLLVVDVQRDFCPGGKLPIERGDTIVPIVNRMMTEGGYDLIVASLDWHPVGHVSFVESHPGSKIGDEVTTKYGSQRCWPTHCVAGTLGAEFHSDLDTSRIDGVVRKGQNVGIDSYSAFFDNGKVQETELNSLLVTAAKARAESPDAIELHIVGLALDVCVAATAFDAVSLNLRTTVVLDGCRGVDESVEAQTKLLQRFGREGISVALSKDIAKPLQPERRAEIQLSA